ncbi:transglycosylase SLT domain-containing protein [Thiolapillus sp.]
MRFFPIILLLFFLVHAAAADVYKFEDEEGRTLLTNIPSNGKGMTLVKRFRFSYARPHSGGRAPVLKVLKDRIRKYKPLILQAARDTGLDTDLIHAVILAESAYDSKAVSPKGAMGLMQLMPATAKRFDVSDAFDPAQNIRGGTRYLKFLMARFGNDLELVTAAYNAGEGAVEKYGRAIPPYKETRLYVKKVRDFMQQGLVAFN